MKYVDLKLADTLSPISVQVQPKDFGDRAYVGLEHIKSGDIVMREVASARTVRSSKWAFQPGDILYGKLRPYLNKCVVADRDGICSTDILVLRPESNIDAKYVAYAMSTRPFVEFANSTVSGMNLPRTTWSKVCNYEFAVPLDSNSKPDLTEQKRVADMLDGTIAQVQVAEGVFKSTVAKSKMLFASHLRDKFFVSKMELTKLGVLCDITSGSGFPHSHQGRRSEKYPFYKVSDMNLEGNEVYMKTHNNSISDEDIKKLKAKIYPAGSIIFPKIGAAIATNKKRILSVPSTVDNNVMVLVPKEGVLSEYLYTFLLDFNLSDWASKSALPSMRKSEVEETKIPMPISRDGYDMKKQEQFASEVNIVQERTLRIRQLADDSLRKLSALRQSVLFSAFSITT